PACRRPRRRLVLPYAELRRRRLRQRWRGRGRDDPRPGGARASHRRIRGHDRVRRLETGRDAAQAHGRLTVERARLASADSARGRYPLDLRLVPRFAPPGPFDSPVSTPSAPRLASAARMGVYMVVYSSTYPVRDATLTRR